MAGLGYYSDSIPLYGYSIRPIRFFRVVCKFEYLKEYLVLIKVMLYTTTSVHPQAMHDLSPLSVFSLFGFATVTVSLKESKVSLLSVGHDLFGV